MEKIQLIIDTDPGIDDTLAIWCACANPLFDVKAITTVAGCTTVEAITKNALTALHYAGRCDIPVYMGAGKPLEGRLHTAEINHGETALGTLTYPENLPTAQSETAADFLARTLSNAAPRSITVLSLAPKTNLALTLRKNPKAAQGIKEIIMMGGAIGYGNTSAVAEFNAFVDPTALKEVLQAGIPTTLIPFDVARTALTSKARIAKLRAAGATKAADLLDEYRVFDETLWQTDGGALPDPLCVAYLAERSLFTTRRVAVGVETESPLTRGQTVIDWYGYNRWLPDEGSHAQWAMINVVGAVDAEGFYAWLNATLGSSSAHTAQGGDQSTHSQGQRRSSL